MERLLVKTKASVNDADFDKQKIDGKTFSEWFRAQGVKVSKGESPQVPDLVESCHGNTEYSIRFAKQMQYLQDQRFRIVTIEAGGLYFARPSLEAANAPGVPIISIPLSGLDSFLAPNIPGSASKITLPDGTSKNVPPGAAAIVGVGPKDYRTAAYIAREILLRDFEGVYIWGTQSVKLEERLRELNIPILGRVSATKPEKVDGILIGETSLADLPKFDASTVLGIYSITCDPNALMRASTTLQHSAYTRGPENCATFAGKIMAAYNKEVKDAIRGTVSEKAESYKQPELTRASFE